MLQWNCAAVDWILINYYQNWFSFKTITVENETTWPFVNFCCGNVVPISVVLFLSSWPPTSNFTGLSSVSWPIWPARLVILKVCSDILIFCFLSLLLNIMKLWGGTLGVLPNLPVHVWFAISFSFCPRTTLPVLSKNIFLHLYLQLISSLASFSETWQFKRWGDCVEATVMGRHR